MATAAAQDSAPPAPGSVSGEGTLTGLCLEAIARHIFQFYNSRLLDRMDSTTAAMCQSLLHSFDVSILERLRDDAKFPATILASLPRKPSKSSLGHEHRFGELLFLEKHCLSARDIDRFGLAFVQAKARTSTALPESPDATEPAEVVDQTFSTSPKEFAFPLPEEHQEDADPSPTKDNTNSARPLTAIAKRGMPLTNFGAHAIADLLQRFDRIERLSLVSCCIGTAGAVVLSLAIAHVKWLKVLDLSNDWTSDCGSCPYSNQIGDDGAMALSCALRTNASVVKVVLSGNPIGPRGGYALADIVRCSNTLQVLHLKQTKIKQAATALVRAYQDSTSLRDLDLEWCRLPPGIGIHLNHVRISRNSKGHLSG
ncbi:hypothetical protein H310_06668 [Aphanomyces invadans]|uniref:Uncharacterized protein n=1 Tax=Aphanomyces invadans TaxID=157072 RepID=A0A024U571_9STRA|nr:hypothetical protein H310_06668 [Aphanomyces invadans]ETW01037.1 hypothetical protein H310_06668 [Aphanomyces invadans]|eukprot:XP_008870035.1 hypothetical protein H310_06668 [Aphanomyces invadans]